MSLTTATRAHDVTYYTAKLESDLSSLRCVCANEEAYEIALQMAKDRAKESGLTLIEAIQLTAREIGNSCQLH